MPSHRRGHSHLSVHSVAQRGGSHLSPHGIHRSGRRWLISAFSLAVVVVVAAVLVVSGRLGRSDDAPPDRPQASAIASEHPTTPTTSSPQGPTATCQAAWNDAHQVLTDAKESIDQWRVHVTAMNQLVAGKITLAHATEFWAQTRTGAYRKYDTFAAADRRFRASSPARACTTSATCARAYDATLDTVRAARVTLARWSRHIGDMDKLRSGMMSPAMAQSMWLENWRQGIPELRNYDRHAKDSAGLHCT